MHAWFEQVHLPAEQREPMNCCEDQTSVQEWRLEIQRAEVSITLIHTDNDIRLQLFAPIRSVSEHEKRTDLFEKCLRFNATTLAGCAFALEEDTLMIQSDRTAIGLTIHHIQDAVSHVMRFAGLRHVSSEQVIDELEEIFEVCQPPGLIGLN